ncbi:MAG: 50S ribosomal protein L5 [Drouetiella hepatica Uher 2000/2452]|jgi:large subunit ribosomal protein L5|uniref:Large ribosomal subunit protein uL5 n=1 Tax=Drouetiella hepatica Uher 2000/2452 TaxID=904376 RepID=A0A951UN32_9CYAN|nr:50S ribosomal protein L5 [Drouetiella hepatica Uher 2000/2452]
MPDDVSLQELQSRIQSILHADTNDFNELTRLLDRNLLEDFSGANLKGVDLSRSNLHNADLSNTDLRNGNLHEADLRSANLRNADLRNANLEDANLENADLRYANMKGANLRRAILCGANLYRADLRECDLKDADLRHAILKSADLRFTNLSSATLSKNSQSGFKKSRTRLKAVYQDITVPYLLDQFKYTNIHKVPKLVKVTVNRGLGEVAQNAKMLEDSLTEIALITGQKPVVTRARKAIAGFKLRKGMPVGILVTLRSDRMYSFLDRLINLALPRIRDFRGISPKAFDGRGNYTLGIREQLIFPEIEYDQITQIRGLDISVITTANTDEEGRALLYHLGMPFRNQSA